MKDRINLLEGPIFSSLTKLALPIMFTSFIQMAYNLTDMIWIGRVGSGAVAAVGAAGMLIHLSQGFITLSRMGGQVKVGQALGSGDHDKARAYARNAIQMAIIFALLYSLVMIINAKNWIGVFNLKNQQIVVDANSYLRIVSAGLIFTFLNQVITGLVTATGNSKTPFRVNAVGLVVNIILDPVMIFGIGFFPEMGVSGAALATVIAQAVVFMLYVGFARKDDLLFANINLLKKLEFKYIKDIAKVGLPSALQNFIFTFISIYIARLIASFGDVAVAVQKVGTQIESISWMTADGFSSALNSFVAQNYGANNIDRVKKGYKSAMKIVIVLGIITTSILVFLPGPIFYLFIPEKDILSQGIDYLRILGVSQLFMCIEISNAGAFAGFGKTAYSSIVSVTFTAMRIPMAILFSRLLGSINGVWWAISISSIFKGVILMIAFNLFLRKYIRKNGKEA